MEISHKQSVFLYCLLSQKKGKLLSGEIRFLINNLEKYVFDNCDFEELELFRNESEIFLKED